MQICVKRAYKEYDKRTVLDIDELMFKDGKVYVILGLNGSGKSTLLNCIAGIEKLDKGNIYYDNTLNIEDVRKNVSIVTQKTYLFNKTVMENIISGLKFRKMDKELIEYRVKKYINYFSLEKLLNKNAKKLSGGEGAKTAMLRIAVLETQLTLLDEPTAAMDADSSLEAEKLIRTMKQNNRTVIVVTHDLYQAERIADYVVFMNNGKIIEKGIKEKVFNNPEHPLVRTILNREELTNGINPY